LKALFKYILLFCFVTAPFGIYSQNIQLDIIGQSSSKNSLKTNYKKKLASTSAARKEIDAYLTQLHYRGYLLASVDSVYGDSTHLTARVSENQMYKTARLKAGNLDPTLASKLGISEKLYLNQAFNYKTVAKSLEKIIVYYENNGFPFATAALDSVTITGNQINAAFNIQKNKFFKIDSIKIEGNARVNTNFLYRYLSIKENMPYNEEALSNISQKLKQLPFVTQTRVQRVQLSNKTNKLLLFIDKKNASQFDGIIGLLPDATTKKTIVTGDIKFKLVNGVLRNGETIDIQWRRMKTQTIDLNGKFTNPYMFGTPFGIDYGIKIYRRDTTFIDINNNFGFQYYFKGLNNIKFYYKQRNNNLISTSGYQFVTNLPEYADMVTQAYGLGALFENTDYRFNPKKGINLSINGQVGNRSIKKNPKINDLAYKNVLLRSTQYQIEGAMALYLNLKGNNVLKMGVQGASVFGNAGIYKNELFRIGGLRTLRGFDEESIFASTYLIPTLEYRFLFSQNSHLLLFAESAWYENNSNHRYLNDTPVSVGAGINFETKAGILSLNYGLGKQLGNSFDLRSGKIHFGFTALL
ncbi:MAG: hypothetical protein IT236_09955, partial [Bacteroidia bacterium]|nr:hypothetical protein [Bacteroidia bacterium]